MQQLLGRRAAPEGAIIAHGHLSAPPAGGGKGADYSIPGNRPNRVMNGFNALGIVAFC